MTGPPARVLSGVCVEMNPLMLVPTALRRAGGDDRLPDCGLDTVGGLRPVMNPRTLVPAEPARRGKR